MRPILLFVFSWLAVGQSAKVIEVSAKDAVLLREANADLDKAQRAMDELKSKIEKNYTVVSDQDPERGSSAYFDSDTLASTGFYYATAPISLGTMYSDPNDPCYKFGEQSSTCLYKRAIGIREKKDGGPKPVVHSKYLRRGWEHGFEFTSDFRFLVPKPAPEPVQVSPCQWGMQGLVVR